MQFFTRVRSLLCALATLSVTLFLTGCFQMEQIIKVKPDGSGTVTMQVVFTKQALEMMKGLQNGGGKGPLDDIMNEDKAKEQAKKLGEGVTFVSVEKVSNDVGEGAKLTFNFTDVTKLKPSMEMQDGGEGEKEPAMTFQFEKGSPAKLTIKAVHKAGPPKPETPDDPSQDAQIQQAAQMMKGMKMTLAVEVEGTITETDAAHRAGSRVTYAEIPFDEIMKDPAKFKQMNKAGEFADAMKILKEVPGVKIEPKETVTISFK